MYFGCRSMVNKDMIILQSCANLEKCVRHPCGETQPPSDDINQVMDIKAEEVTDREEEEVPVPVMFPKIKAEAEVSLCL